MFFRNLWVIASLVTVGVLLSLISLVTALVVSDKVGIGDVLTWPSQCKSSLGETHALLRWLSIAHWLIVSGRPPGHFC